VSLLFQLLLLLHIGAGLLALVFFWSAIFSPKGGRFHVFSGKSFAWCSYAVVASGLIRFAALIVTPHHVGTGASENAFYYFFAYLAVVTLATVRHGVRVVQTRRDPMALRTPFHIAVNATAFLSGLGMVALGSVTGQVLFAAMAPIGILVGWFNLKYIRNPPRDTHAWWYEHMGSMIGGGIAMHTAFLVFGLPRLMNVQLRGMTTLAAFLLPTLVGLPATMIWVSYYKRKFTSHAEGATR
jgi:hypothetical protein